jgi:hypothetical protein
LDQVHNQVHMQTELILRFIVNVIHSIQAPA